MASLSYEDTLVVPKLATERAPLASVRRLAPSRARSRPLTTQFAPTRTVRWPWLVAAALWIAAVATPIDLNRELRLSTHAHEVLRVLSSQ